MAIWIRGNAVSNAESYSLHKKVGATFDTTALITSTNGLNFDLSDLYNRGILKDGAYIFAVRAHAPDYESSDFSNEVSYTFGTPVAPTNYTFTINPNPTSATVTLSATGYSTVSGTGSQSITVANGTEVNWRVSADGYTEQNGTWTANGSNESKSVNLVEIDDGDDVVAINLYDKDIVNQYYKNGCFLAASAKWYVVSSFRSTNLIPINRDGSLYIYGIKTGAEFHLTWWGEDAVEEAPTADVVGTGNVFPVGGFTIKNGTNVGSGNTTMEAITDTYGTECLKLTIAPKYNTTAKYIRLGIGTSAPTNGFDNIYIANGERKPE